MSNIIQDLSNIYVTLQEIEIKGKQSIPYAICIQTLERCIDELNKENQKNKNDK